MCKNNIDERASMLEVIAKINAIEGFDPSVFVEDFTDLSTGEVRKRLPVVVLISMFRMKYPDGKITVSVTPKENSFVATAKVYPNYKDSEKDFLAEATVEREPVKEKPTISAMEWAQTAAIGVALRNAGFGLQYAFSGEELDNLTPNGLGATKQDETPNATVDTEAEPEKVEPETVKTVEPAPELTLEQKYEQAMQCPCPITKYRGKTLGEVLPIDPTAINWIATKFENDEKIREAAKIICEYAKSQKAA